MQGLGMAICEEMLVEDGRVTTLAWAIQDTDGADVPARKTTLVTGAYPGPGPFNAKPAGGTCITPIPPSVGSGLQRHRRAPDESADPCGKVYQGLQRKQ